jgi:hypothetical protein
MLLLVNCSTLFRTSAVDPDESVVRAASCAGSGSTFRGCSEPPCALPAQGPCLPLRFQAPTLAEVLLAACNPELAGEALATRLAITAGALDGAGCFGFAIQTSNCSGIQVYICAAN